MGRLGKGITRFPHLCSIYTMIAPTPFSEGGKSVVWEGRCRKESNTSIRTFKGAESVIKSDYRVQLGALVGGELSGDANAAYDGKQGQECGAVVGGIQAGMFIDVTDKNGTFEAMTISDAYAGELGTSVYFDNPKN